MTRAVKQEKQNMSQKKICPVDIMNFYFMR